MYDTEVTRMQLRNAQRRLGFELEPHSIAEIEATNRHLAGVINDDGKPTRSLTSRKIFR